MLVAVANVLSEMGYTGREEYRTSEKNRTSYQRAVVSDRVVNVAAEGVPGGKDKSSHGLASCHVVSRGIASLSSHGITPT